MIEWRHVPSILDAGPAPRAAIGLVALASDVVSEPELRRFLPPEGVGLYANRIPMPEHATVETLTAMGDSIDRVVDGLVPDIPLDVIAYGCTAAATMLGSATLAARVRARRATPVGYSDPFLAGVVGLRALGLRRIAMLTPYEDPVGDVVAGHFADAGFTLVRGASFKRRGDPDMSRIPPAAIARAAIELGRARDVDGVFISCTALRVSPVLARIERAIAKPVVSSNQALAWHCLRLAGDREALSDRGCLFGVSALLPDGVNP